MDALAKENSYRTLAAHGLAVGLSDGLMGNSEVGYVTSLGISILYFAKRFPKALEHRRRTYRMARYCQDRRLDKEASVPQERQDRRELQAREGWKWSPSPSWFGGYAVIIFARLLCLHVQ